MLIEFDPAKDAKNLKKHGVSLAVAEFFDWEHGLVGSARTVRDEHRLRIIAEAFGVLYVAIFTPRGPKQRIISLRRAGRRERQRYETR
jgi:uncharacterized protein